MSDSRQSRTRPGHSGVGSSPQQNRSCEECNRKKSRCDRKIPRCSRCGQSDKKCTYPTKRKRPTLETQYRTFRQQLLKANKGPELDKLLDKLDSDGLQVAIRKRQDRSLSTTTSSEQEASTSSVQASSHQTVADSLPELSQVTEVNQPNMSQFSHAYMPYQDSDEAFQDTMQILPVSNDWDIQDLFVDAPQSGTDFLASDIDWPQIGNVGFFQSTISDPGQSPTAVLVEDKSGNDYAIPLPPSLVDISIELFFEKVQCFIPLFHAPNFRARFRVHDSDETRYSDLTIEDALILNGMLALSTRFISSPYFGETTPKARARIFGSKAKALYDEILRMDKLEQSSLSLLQGCILLSFYQQTSLPTTQSWLLIGTCCRLAMDLGLNTLDEYTISSGLTYTANSVTPEEWSQREEQRRAWWLVWELDVFASTISRRPHGIDRSQMHVLLPVSDEYWFSDTFIPSTPIKSDPFQAWDSLSGCPNQDERVWFLLSTFMMATAHDLSSRWTTTAQELKNFESTLDCFTLLLPTNFHLSSGQLIFTERNFANCNWIISTIFMLHTIRVLLRRALKAKSQEQTSMASCFGTTAVDVYNDAELVFRAMQAWLPEFISYACPFIVCTIIGPAFDNVRAAHGSRPNQHNIHLDLLKLVLKRVGTFWDIGTAALRLIQIFENGHLADEPSGERESQTLKKSFSLLVHDHVH